MFIGDQQTSTFKNLFAVFCFITLLGQLLYKHKNYWYIKCDILALLYILLVVRVKNESANYKAIWRHQEYH